MCNVIAWNSFRDEGSKIEIGWRFCRGRNPPPYTNLGHVTPFTLWTPSLKCIYVFPLTLPHYVYEPAICSVIVAHDVCYNERHLNVHTYLNF